MQGSSSSSAAEEEKLLTVFEKLCFTHGDADAIRLATGESLCYLELQELSIILASQLHYRFRPAVVLVDCYGHVVAETVSILACLRLGVPFVPVSVYDQHAGAGRLEAVVQELRQHMTTSNIVAICGAENDRDPALGIFYHADIHQILYVDRLGNLWEQIQVPRYQGCIDAESTSANDGHDDDLYILFTSGTSSNNPKAVVGSQKSTCRRLQWFRDTFPPSPRIARRTRLTFVDSMTELFGALLHPPSLLVAVEPDELRDQGLESLLTALNPTQLTLLPSQLALLFLLEKEMLSCLERVIVSGEPCPALLVHAAKEKLSPSCQLINLYGQTESTGDALAAVLTDLGEQAIHNGVVAVGSPILPSIIVMTTDKDELVIEGNLANGYLGDSSPFKQFSTGDVGFCVDGTWYIKGRCDDVVKVNGVLTSPSEVETAFSTLYDTGPVAAIILETGRVYVICESQVPTFSRHQMHEAGIPWNLIPTQLLHHSIPVSDTGAGKVNRAATRKLVQQHFDQGSKASPTTAARSTTTCGLQSIIADVLHLKTIDPAKSFVELGGDSASSIHLLYRLQQAKLMVKSKLSAWHILEASSINEIESLLSGSTKRRRVEPSALLPQAFSTQSTKRFSESHVAVPFLACVDARAAPVDGQDCLYACCQGGLVYKFNSSGSVLGHHYFPGWKFEADCFLVGHETETFLLVCGFNDEGKGLVASLDQTLEQIQWQQVMEGEIRLVPVFVRRGSTDEVWVRSSNGLEILDALSGKTIRSVPLSNESYGRPLVDVARQTVWYTGVVLTSIGYGGEGIKVHEHEELADTVGPCHKGGVLADDKLLLSDSWGQIHVADFGSKKIQHTIYVAGCPLSSPTLYGKERRYFLVGCYDGRLVSFRFGESALEAPTKEWEIQVGASIYARPLILPNQTTCVACTTAGDVVVICTDTYTILQRFRVPGEVWSDPEIVGKDKTSTCFHVAFGARDSRVHIIRLETK